MRGKSHLVSPRSAEYLVLVLDSVMIKECLTGACLAIMECITRCISSSSMSVVQCQRKRGLFLGCAIWCLLHTRLSCVAISDGGPDMALRWLGRGGSLCHSVEHLLPSVVTDAWPLMVLCEAVCIPPLPLCWCPSVRLLCAWVLLVVLN